MTKKKYCTREELLERIKTTEKEKELPGIGLVKYRNLSFGEQQKLLTESDGNHDYAARGVILSFLEPQLSMDDLQALKDGAFGPLSVLSKLPFEDMKQGPVKESDLGKPQESLEKTKL